MCICCFVEELPAFQKHTETERFIFCDKFLDIVDPPNWHLTDTNMRHIIWIRGIPHTHCNISHLRYLTLFGVNVPEWSHFVDFIFVHQDEEISLSQTWALWITLSFFVQKNAKLSLDRVNLSEICWVCLVVLARFTLYPNIFDFAHKDVMRDCQPLSVWPDREFIRPIPTVVNQEGDVMFWNSTYLQILTLGYRSV